MYVVFSLDACVPARVRCACVCVCVRMQVCGNVRRIHKNLSSDVCVCGCRRACVNMRL